MFVPNFKILGQVVLEKSLTKISICITLEREIEKRKKIEKEGKIKSLFTVIHLVVLIVYTKFEYCSTHRF